MDYVRVPVALGNGQSPGSVTDSLSRQPVGVGGRQRSPVWSGSEQAFCVEMPVSRGNRMSREWCSLWWSLFGSLSLGWWGPGSSRHRVFPLNGGLGPRGRPDPGPRLPPGVPPWAQALGLAWAALREGPVEPTGVRSCPGPVSALNSKTPPSMAIEIFGFLFPQKSMTGSRSCMPSRRYSRNFQRKTTKSSNTSSLT